MDISPISSAISSTLAGMPDSSMRSLTRPGQTPAQQRKAAAGQFEQILLREFLTKSVGSMMGGEDTPQGSVYGYLLTDTLAQRMAAGGGMGLSKMIEQQLTPPGENGSAAPTAKNP